MLVTAVKVVRSLNGTRWNRPWGLISVSIKIEDIHNELIKGFEESQVVLGLLLFLLFFQVASLSDYSVSISHSDGKDIGHPFGCLFRDSHTVAYSSCRICVYSRQYGAWPGDKNCCNLILLLLLLLMVGIGTKTGNKQKKKKRNGKKCILEFTLIGCVSQNFICAFKENIHCVYDNNQWVSQPINFYRIVFDICHPYYTIDTSLYQESCEYASVIYGRFLCPWFLFFTGWGKTVYLILCNNCLMHFLLMHKPCKEEESCTSNENYEECVGVNLKAFQSCHHFSPCLCCSVSVVSFSAKLRKGESS